VQLLYKWNQTLKQYVAQQGWKSATLLSCPLHPEGGCSLQRWGTYTRLIPTKCKIARYYCRESRTTFSLLPDFFAARMPGTLKQAQQAAQGVERAKAKTDGSLEKQAELVRQLSENDDPIEPRSAVAWMQRRYRAVSRGLAVVVTLLPMVFGGCEPTMTSVGRVLDNTDTVLVQVRHLAQDKLGQIPSPIGFSTQKSETNKGHGRGPARSVVCSVYAASSSVDKGAESWIKRKQLKQRSPPT